MLNFIYENPNFSVTSLVTILLLLGQYLIIVKGIKVKMEAKKNFNKMFLTTYQQNIFVIFNKAIVSLEENRKYVIPKNTGYKEPAVLIGNEITGCCAIKESIREYLEKGEIEKIHVLFERISSDEILTCLLKEMTSNFTTWSKTWKEASYM